MTLARLLHPLKHWDREGIMTRMKDHRTDKMVVLIIAVLSLFGISGCANPLQLRVPSFVEQDGAPAEPVADEDDDAAVVPEPVSAVQRVSVKATEFSIAWDYDQETAGSFTVYYRIVTSGQWLLLMAGLTAPSFDIDDSMLEYGEYEFAVSFTPENGEESGLHTSLDTTAMPNTGWYIAWEGLD